MNMNEEFLNVYIETMNKKIEDLTRSELLLQVRLNISDKSVNKKIEEYNLLREEIENTKSNKNKMLESINERVKALTSENVTLKEQNDKLHEISQHNKNLTSEVDMLRNKIEALEKEKIAIASRKSAKVREELI